VATLGTLGVVCRRQGRPAEAAKLHRRALRLLHGRVAPDHPHISALQENLASTERAQARLTTAHRDTTQSVAFAGRDARVRPT
jgi:hypothetical protein